MSTGPEDRPLSPSTSEPRAEPAYAPPSVTRESELQTGAAAGDSEQQVSPLRAVPPLAREGQAASVDQYAVGGSAGEFSPKPPSGTVAWAMGFLAYIPIPFVGSVITGFVMMLVGNGQRAKGETARLNGRNAANWGFTYLVATVVLIGAAVLTLSTSVGPDGRVPDAVSGIALTLIGVWAFPLQILHLVLTIMGTVKASRGRVFAKRFVIPLLR